MCKFNDCGWCYANAKLKNNSANGQCQKPKSCTQNNLIPVKNI